MMLPSQVPRFKVACELALRRSSFSFRVVRRELSGVDGLLVEEREESKLAYSLHPQSLPPQSEGYGPRGANLVLERFAGEDQAFWRWMGSERGSCEPEADSCLLP